MDDTKADAEIVGAEKVETENLVDTSEVVAQSVESKINEDNVSAGMQNGGDKLEDKKDAINANQEPTKPK